MTEPIRMLVADDSHLVQRLILDAAAQSQLPLRITTTDNGRDCPTMLNSREIDLAFIDVHMPDLSGTDALWSAKKQGVQTFVTLMSSPPAPQAVSIARIEGLRIPFQAPSRRRTPSRSCRPMAHHRADKNTDRRRLPDRASDHSENDQGQPVQMLDLGGPPTDGPRSSCATTASSTWSFSIATCRAFPVLRPCSRFGRTTRTFRWS